MTPLPRERRLALAALAGRAPSPHNIQPARWRFGDGTVELREVPSRWLDVGDPTGRDNRIALGMAWEGMALALSREGLGLDTDAVAPPSYPPPSDAPRLVAHGRLVPAPLDALAAMLDVRRSWRGDFPPADAARLAALDACLARHADVALALPPTAASALADDYDAAAAQGLADPAFARELHRWMRFSPAHPDWTRDGLAADCMVLSGIEAWGASIALRPRVVRVLSALSLLRAVVGEAGKVRSAARLVAIHAPDDADAFAAGRAWYRFWLDLAATGFAAVPMSALVDSPAHARKLLAAWPLPPGRKLVNLMRVGPAPAGGIPASARLPAAELLLDAD